MQRANIRPGEELTLSACGGRGLDRSHAARHTRPNHGSGDTLKVIVHDTYGARREDTRGYRPCDVDLAGHVALVTGANSGMGTATAREIARIGAQVILRSCGTARGEAAANEIVETTGRHRVTVMAVDRSSLAAVRAVRVRSLSHVRSWTCS
jgi:hypothetical protein